MYEAFFLEKKNVHSSETTWRKKSTRFLKPNKRKYRLQLPMKAQIFLGQIKGILNKCFQLPIIFVFPLHFSHGYLTYKAMVPISITTRQTNNKRITMKIINQFVHFLCYNILFYLLSDIASSRAVVHPRNLYLNPMPFPSKACTFFRLKFARWPMSSSQAASE